METRYNARGFPQRLGSLRLPLFPQPRRRYYLRTINLEVGPFYSIEVGSFYVVKAIARSNRNPAAWEVKRNTPASMIEVPSLWNCAPSGSVKE